MVDSLFGLGPMDFVEDLEWTLRLQPRCLNFSSAVGFSVSDNAVGGVERVTHMTGLRNTLSRQGDDGLGAITSKPPTV
jgi:hypothetical protein